MFKECSKRIDYIADILEVSGFIREAMVLDRVSDALDKLAMSTNDPGNFYYHGSPSGDLVGSKSGIHVGTYKAAKQALEARIGVPATGEWDGTREYGKTLLKGKNIIGEYECTGYNCGSDIPDDNYYPTDRKILPVYSGGGSVGITSKPIIYRVKIVGPMTNSPSNPLSDTRANAQMKSQITKGKARSGYYYKNDGEDYGSISAVVPDGTWLQRA